MSTRTRTEHRDGTGRGRGLKQRGMPFAGLLLAPFLAFAAGLVVHGSVADSMVAVGLTAAGISAVTTLLAVVAYLLGHKRTPVVCWHVVVTVVLAGLAEAVTVVVGFERWWATAFLIAGEILACSWGLHRIDALRKDAKGEEAKEDQLTKKLGLESMKFGPPKHHTNDQGEVTRIEVPVKHGSGETVQVVQAAVPGIESVANAPRGRSRAVPGEGAGTSNLVIITQDVLKLLVPYPGPSSPGGCVTEPLVHGVYEDQRAVLKYIAGGRPEAPNPASSGWMGMTRTGKTANAQVCALEIMSRRNVQIMWFDTIKGAQTVRPLRRGLDIIVASDDPRTFRAGMKALMALIKFRADRIGECGYEAWTTACATDPRLMMPFLVVHFEECDALCDQAGEEMVFLASKGLSAGVSCGFSLQRADATSMPTGLRFNIGNWSVFGCGDEYSAGFALSSATIDAGAHPENWKQSKPGYSYHEGIGIDDDRGPVTAKSFYANAQAMEAHAEVWGPRMQPLDRGSIAALGDWYVKAKAETLAQVARWDAGPAAEPIVHDGASTSTNTDPDDEEITDMGDDEGMPQLEDAEPGDAALYDSADPSQPIPPSDGPNIIFDEDLPEARSEGDAWAAFDALLAEMSSEPGREYVEIRELVERFKFRDRSTLSRRVSAIADGAIVAPPGLTLERTDKVGRYHIRILAGTPSSNGR